MGCQALKKYYKSGPSEAIFKCDVRFDGISSYVSCNWTKCNKFEYACVKKDISWLKIFFLTTQTSSFSSYIPIIREFSIFSYMYYFCGVFVMFWSLTGPILSNFYCIGNIYYAKYHFCVSSKILLLRAIEMALGWIDFDR